MSSEILLMNGYGLYVWSAFTFTFLCFTLLYIIIKIQYVKEKNKFLKKFGSLNTEKAAIAKSQSINKVILSNTSSI